MHNFDIPEKNTVNICPHIVYTFLSNALLIATALCYLKLLTSQGTATLEVRFTVSVSDYINPYFT